MILHDPRDFHYLALCLAHGLASPSDLTRLLHELEQTQDRTLGDLLVHHGILTPYQHQVVQDEIVANPRLLDALSPGPGAALSAALPAAHTVTLELLEEHGGRTGFALHSHPVEHGFRPSRSDETASLPGGPEPESLDNVGSSRSVVASFSTGLRERRPARELVGCEIAGYVIEGVLGKGGQGQVFKARQRSLDRLVALKILPPDMAADQEFISRFLAEARTLATFTHPNIVQVYDVGVEDGVYYFAMEAVRGQSLKDLLASEGRLQMEVGLNLLKQCLRGLERAAREGVIHRDIKPGNLLIDEQGILKIADFGLAEKTEEGGTLTSNRVVGTPFYISPEQVRGRDVSSRADQYSLGATFFHLLTGHPPFEAPTSRDMLLRHLEVPCPDPCEHAADMHPELGAILQRTMAKDPGARFSSFQHLFKVIEDFELRTGLIETRSSFLSEGLINIGERSVRALGAKVALGTAIGVSTTLLAIGASELLDRTGREAWKGPLGNAGATLLLLGFAAIMYIAGVRKRWLPKLGNVRIWLQAHIAMALTGYFLSQVHSGNFLRFFTGPQVTDVPGSGPSYSVVPVIPFLNSFLFTAVVVSGLVGRYIWRDIANQVATDRIQRGLEEDGRESHELTLSIFAQKALRYWRIFHYPMAFALVVVTLVHVISIFYYGG